MVAEATRGVRFVLKAETDASVGRELNAVAERVAQIQAMLGNFKLGGLDVGQLTTSVDKANAALDAVQKRAMTPINLTPYSTSAVATQQSLAGAKSLPSSAGADPTTSARVAANGRATKIEAEQEAELTRKEEAETDKRSALPEKVVRNRIAMLARVQKADADKAAAERAEADQEIAALEKRAAAEQKAADQREKVNAKAVDAVIAGWNEDAAAKERAEDKKRAAANKMLASLVKGGADAQKQDAETHERALRKTEELNSRIRASLAEAVSGTTELARGFVELGLIGEEDFNKVRDSILGVQSVMDQVRGGMNTWHSLSEASRLYGERLEAVANAAKAAEAVKAASGVAPAAQAAGSVAGGAVGSAGGLLGILAAANPVTIGLAALAAAVVGSVYALNKYTEALGEAEKKATESRKRELEIREEQNAKLMAVFQKEQQARERQGARDALALKTSQEFGEKRGQYEAEADKLGLKGQGRERDVSHQAAIDQTKFDIERIEKEMAATAQQPERSREMEETKEPKPQKSEQGIADRAKFLAQQAAVASPIGAVWEMFHRGEKPKENVKPATGFNRYAASPEIDNQAKEKTKDLEHRKHELELQLREQEQQRFRDQAAALNEELQGQQQLIEGDKQRVEQAVEYAKQTNDAYHSALAGFGHLSKAKQQRAIGLQEKLDRGEKLSNKDLEFAEQNLGKRGKKQAQEQFEDRVDPRAQHLFSEEEEDRGKGAEKVGQSMGDAAVHLAQLAETMERIAALNARAPAGGGEKAVVHVDANNHATLEIKWDQQVEGMMAKAIQPELAKWQASIEAMLENAKAEIEQTFRRTLQKRNQTTAAGS